MRRVKDKRITVSGGGYLATVEYYQDTPNRDGHYPRTQLFLFLLGAQRWLDQFPRDEWAGAEMSSYNYREIDERKKNVKRKNRRNPEAALRASGYCGRTFARPT